MVVWPRTDMLAEVEDLLWLMQTVCASVLDPTRRRQVYCRLVAEESNLKVAVFSRLNNKIKIYSQ